MSLSPSRSNLKSHILSRLCIHHSSSQLVTVPHKKYSCYLTAALLLIHWRNIGPHIQNTSQCRRMWCSLLMSLGRLLFVFWWHRIKSVYFFYRTLYQRGCDGVGSDNWRCQPGHARLGWHSCPTPQKHTDKFSARLPMKMCTQTPNSVSVNVTLLGTKIFVHKSERGDRDS